MVLGLINFLLGGKKKSKIPRSAQVASPRGNIDASRAPQFPAETVQTTPNGNTPPSQNNSDLKFKDMSSKSSEAAPAQQETVSQMPIQNQGSSRQSVNTVIGKIHNELKSTNETLGELVGNVRNIENNMNSLGHRIDDLEEGRKVLTEKVTDIEANMGKFLSLYELINNQYNPFVDNEKQVKTVEIAANGSSINSNSEPNSFEDLNLKGTDIASNGISTIVKPSLESSLLELDTLNIEEAAGDAVPLTKLKNNTNSLVIILSWLEFLIKKVGIEETRNSLRYYTETLRWITPEVYFDLDKYLRGMKDRANVDENAKLTVKDHIVSLYFVSKLNEKSLDAKLTTAVLELIKN